MNFTQVLINNFYFVINKNGSQLNALLNLNDSCLGSFIDFIQELAPDGCLESAVFRLFRSAFVGS